MDEKNLREISLGFGGVIVTTCDMCLKFDFCIEFIYGGVPTTVTKICKNCLCKGQGKIDRKIAGEQQAQNIESKVYKMIEDNNALGAIQLIAKELHELKG